MHRNTRLLIVALAVIAALLIGINIGRSMGSPAPVVAIPTLAPTPTTPPVSTVVYTNKTCGITFAYPSTLTPSESSPSGTVLSDPKNPQDTVTVVCQPGIPRVPLMPEKIETLSIPSASGSATASARLYHDISQKDGSPVDKLIFANRKNGLDVYIAGFGTVYNSVISSLKLL